ALLLTGLSIFYIFFLPSFFNLNVFVLENREVVEVTIVNSFFIFNKMIDQFFICTLFSIIAFLILNSKLKYLVLTVTIVALAFLILENSSFYLDVVTISSLPVILFVIVLGNIYNIRIITTKKISLSLFFNYFITFLIIASI